MNNDAPGYGLAHPVYLDVPMMLSFLAHLEGGFSISETETTTASGARERFLKARGSLRAKLWAVGEGSAETEASTQNRDETQTESQTERHHTEASLFNLLYEYLNEDNQVVRIADTENLTDLYSGQLVELSGEYLGNPIEDILTFFDAFVPYVAEEETEKSQASGAQTTKAQKKRSGNPSVRAAASQAPTQASGNNESEDMSWMRLMKRMSQDIESAPVHDLLFRTEHGLEAVITAASLYYSATTTEYLRAGEFRVIGKVTKVVKEGDAINLTRRTVLGAAGPDVAEDMISGITEAEGFDLGVANPIVSGPAIQILPMAIFI
ncbi:DUF6414 family protein [Kocuria turfanensis]|uniref:DUF6414 family protein n=1 Tax=Kocuria turfanensis TaxID=388357 RepID=UPI00403510C8